MHVYVGKVFTKYFVAFLAAARVTAEVTVMGAMFQICIASVMHVLCMIGLKPGIISLP